MNVSLILLLMLSITLAEATTLDPSFQLSFDGFVVFLKEVAALRIRHQKVKDTGRSLANRIDYLEAAILKTNRTIQTPLEKMTSITDNTRNLDVRMMNVRNTVKKTRQKMARLQNSTNHTTQGSIDLAKLADETNTTLAVLREVIDNVSPSMEEFQNSTSDLKYKKDKLQEQIEEISKKTRHFEMVQCDSGFGYDNSASTRTLHFPRPFNSTPSILYGLTQLDISMTRYNYNMIFNVTMSSVTNSGMSVTTQKDSYSSIRESEYNWMACYT